MKVATIMLALVLAASAAEAGRHHGRPGVMHGHAINAWGGSHHLKLR